MKDITTSGDKELAHLQVPRFGRVVETGLTVIILVVDIATVLYEQLCNFRGLVVFGGVEEGSLVEVVVLIEVVVVGEELFQWQNFL